MENLIVGDENCSISQIVEYLRDHECAVVLFHGWRTLARRLDTPGVKFEKLDQDLLRNEKDVFDVLSDLLQTWKLRSSKEAKFSKLIGILDDGCNWKAIADHLQKKFAEQISNRNIKQNRSGQENTVKIFKTPPKFIHDFLSDPELLALVVQTDDIELTCTRFIETVLNSIVYDSNEFLRHISTSPLIPTNMIYVVICENKLELILQLLLSDSSGKFVHISAKSAANLSDPKIKFVEHHFDWNDLSPVFKSEIQSTCEELTGLSGAECVSVLPKTDYSVILEIIHGKVPTLLRETIPEDISYYIPRRLKSRYILDNSLFRYGGNDIFLIHNIDRLKLSELVNGRATGTSSNFLFHPFDFTTKFVVLEELSHFELIVDKYKSKSIAMHLVSYNSEAQLIWRKSTAGIKTIQEFVSKHQTTISEEDAFNDFLNSNKCDAAICFSDAPGMGKSILLAHFSRLLKSPKACHPLSVCFVTISELAEKFIATEGHVNSTERILSAMASCLCQNELGVAYFIHYHNEIKDIVLDGLDELSPDICDGYELIKLVQREFCQSRIWVATRPHLLLDLERTLNVIGYEIDPFDDTDQILFLKKYWSRSLKQTLDPKKLAYFATTCLSILKATISSENDCDVAGIPLQCLLIGEIFEDDLKVFIRSNSNIFPTVSIESMTNLYDRLVKKKYDTFFKRYDKKGLNEAMLTSAHIKLSMSLLFPKFKEQQENTLINLEFCMDDIINVGIVLSASISSAPRFIHRTFAEYFLARFVVDILQIKYSEENFKFIFEHVFETRPISASYFNTNTIYNPIETRGFTNYVICYFVDALLINTDKILWNTETNILEPAIETELLASKKLVKNVAEASVRGNFESLLRTIVCISQKFRDLESNIFSKELLFLCTMNSTKSLATYVFRKFSQLNQDIFFSDISRDDQTLLHYAIVRSDYEIFEFVLCQQNICDKLKAGDKPLSDIILTCVEYTYSLPDLIVKSRCDMIKRLHGINPDLILKLNDLRFSDFYPKIHINLLITLLELGHEIYNDDSLVQVLHNATYSSNSKQYMRLLEYFQNTFSKEINEQIFNETCCGNTLIEQLLSKVHPVNEKVLDLLKQFGVNFHSRKEEKHSILHLAIEKMTSSSCLKWLLLNLTLSKKQMENAFWHAHDYQNFEFLKLVVRLKRIAPNLQDNLGFTSLHRMCGASSETTSSFLTNITTIEYVKLLITHGAKVTSRNMVFYRTRRPVEYLVDNVPSVPGFQVLDLLQTALSPHDKAFQKWKWLMECDNIDEVNFRDCAEICVREIGDINTQDRDGNTFMHFVAKFRNTRALKYLITRSVKSNLTNKKGETPLHLAVTNLNQDQFKNSELLDLKRLLVYSFENCAWKTIIFFSAWYALVLKQPLSKITLDSEGKRSLLEYVLSKHDADILEYFVGDDFGTKVLKTLKNKWIYEFVKKRNTDNGEFLRMVARIDPDFVNTRNDEGFVPLSMKGIDDDWVKPLVDLGADVNLADSEGNTPLHWALKHDHENVRGLVYELEECGADVNSETRAGETPLTLALNLSDLWSMCSSVKNLLEGNADVGRRDSHGDTFLHLLPSKLKHDYLHGSKEFQFHSILKIVLEKGRVDVLEVRGSNNLTPIQIAQKHFQLKEETLEILTEYGVTI